jgi:hypothetical protein
MTQPSTPPPPEKNNKKKDERPGGGGAEEVRLIDWTTHAHSIDLSHSWPTLPKLVLSLAQLSPSLYINIRALSNFCYRWIKHSGEIGRGVDISPQPKQTNYSIQECITTINGQKSFICHFLLYNQIRLLSLFCNVIVSNKGMKSDFLN